MNQQLQQQPKPPQLQQKQKQREFIKEGLNEQLNAPNLIENKTEKVNLSTSNTIPHNFIS